MNNTPDSFSEACYELLRTVPKGKVTTYQELAHGLGCRAYRAVGLAMNRNPYPPEEVPCHRVVKANGELGGYAGEESEKQRKLENEGIIFDENGKIQEFSQRLHRFSEL